MDFMGVRLFYTLYSIMLLYYLLECKDPDLEGQSFRGKGWYCKIGKILTSLFI